METPNVISQTDDIEFAALSEARNYRAALLAEFAPFLRGNVLEVGAGIGQFSEAIHAFLEVRRLVCVEPEPRFCDKFRALHPELSLVPGTVDEVPAGTDWDAILCINVLEHIREDQTELAKYHGRLAGNHGHLCLFVPARPEIYAPIDQDFGHFRRYVKAGLGQQLRQAGFEIVTLEYFNCVGYLAWWLNFCVLKKRGFDVPSVRLFDRVIFPVVHGLESRICRPPLGQSLLAVARAVPRVGSQG